MRHFIVLALFATLASAATVEYTASGVFGPGVPTSIFTAPNQTWAFVFRIEQNPSVSATGNTFEPAYSGFSYWLNGSNTGVSPFALTFFTAALGGMFDLRLTVDDSFSFFGSQMFSGPTFSPTMLEGTFIAGEYGGIFVGTSMVQSLEGTQVTATIPEPATFSLGAAGLLLLAGATRRVGRQHQP